VTAAGKEYQQHKCLNDNDIVNARFFFLTRKNPKEKKKNGDHYNDVRLKEAGRFVK